MESTGFQAMGLDIRFFFFGLTNCLFSAAFIFCLWHQLGDALPDFLWEQQEAEKAVGPEERGRIRKYERSRN